MREWTPPTLQRHQRTESEGVAGVAVGAGTDRDVVGDSTDGGEAARARTGVAALAVDAGLVHGAVGADQTLGSAALVRVALELWQAFAHSE